jgi:aminoglycoside 6'-N-acetyltransferase I
MNLKIIDLDAGDAVRIEQVATILVAGFREHWPDAWPDLGAALAEVHESFGVDRISRVALSESGAVLGWIGGICQYRGRVWEIHPLVVSLAYQRRGIGRALVADLERLVRERGALTLWVGTDDEDEQTTLSGVDLYSDVCEHIRNIRNLGHHPYEFYQKLGFVIVGVLPDANGPGKPDIFMAKRVIR